MANTTLQTDLKLECSRCGRDCGDGYQERVLSTDSETGYQDVEIVCGPCVDEENGLTDEDYRDICAYHDYDCQVEEF
jgi:hypothetical protein